MTVEIIMSSISLAAAAIAMLGCASAFAQTQGPIVCPQKYVDKSGHAGRLTLASVFDGVPEKKGDLIPDLTTGEWDLSTAQQDTKERGESFYLVCHYKGLADTVRFQLPHEIKLCKMFPAKGGIRAYCK
jgi:hypothetical protein